MGSTVVRSACGITMRRSILPKRETQGARGLDLPHADGVDAAHEVLRAERRGHQDDREDHARARMYGSTRLRLGSAYTMMMSSDTPGMLRNTCT